jgi:hypothetical protein
VRQRLVKLVGRNGQLAVASQASAARESGSSAGRRQRRATTSAGPALRDHDFRGHATVPAIRAALAGTALTS